MSKRDALKLRKGTEVIVCPNSSMQFKMKVKEVWGLPQDKYIDIVGITEDGTEVQNCHLNIEKA